MNTNLSNILVVKDLTKGFDGLKAVDEVTMEIKKESIVSIIGPNGAGKTTCFNLINGFLYPDKGRITYKGRDITLLPSWRRANLGIGRLFQDIRVFRKLTVYENMLVAIKERGILSRSEKSKKANKSSNTTKEGITFWLDFVGLLDKRNTLAENLSWGQQKLLSLARLLVGEFDLLLLDEPVSGVNPAMVEKILEKIKSLQELGKTVLVVEHDLEAVKQISDYIYFMDSGRILYSGVPEEILGNSDIMKRYIGV